MITEPVRLDLRLDDGRAVHAVIGDRVIGVAIGDRACLAHGPWMTAAELRRVALYAAELVDVVES